MGARPAEKEREKEGQSTVRYQRVQRENELKLRDLEERNGLREREKQSTVLLQEAANKKEKRQLTRDSHA